MSSTSPIYGMFSGEFKITGHMMVHFLFITILVEVKTIIPKRRTNFCRNKL